MSVFHSLAHRKIIMSAAVLTSVLAAPLAFAHKTYLASDHAVWDAGAEVTVSLTSALEFPDVETGPSRDRIAFAAARVGQNTTEDFAYEESQTALRVSFTPPGTGFTTVAISALPRSGEIAPEDVAVYFDEIGAGMEVRAAFDALPGDPAMMRSYTKHTKIFLCVETCETGAELAGEPTGQALEFVAGSESDRTFILLWQGEALTEHDVDIYDANGGHERVTTGSEGAFEVGPNLTGPILMSAVRITLPDEPAGTYHSDQATLSVTLR